MIQAQFVFTTLDFFVAYESAQEVGVTLTQGWKDLSGTNTPAYWSPGTVFTINFLRNLVMGQMSLSVCPRRGFQA
jgi:hypothetical protein